MATGRGHSAWLRGDAEVISCWPRSIDNDNG
jgi:hypothetical protein